MDNYIKAKAMIEDVVDCLNRSMKTCQKSMDAAEINSMIFLRGAVDFAVSEGTRRLNSIGEYLKTGIIPEWYEDKR